VNFTKLAQKILTSKEVSAEPPILVDIGASGQIHPKWSLIAPYSICIAADADRREMEYSEKADSQYKKLYVIHRVVTETTSSEIDFYLTKSPYCSSSLPPDNDKLASWSFAELFQVEKIVKLPAAPLSSILHEMKIERIDWFKTDSQGTDLRLFASLPGELLAKILVAEFEPGILDAYQGEDKLWQVLAYWKNDISGCQI